MSAIPKRALGLSLLALCSLVAYLTLRAAPTEQKPVATKNATSHAPPLESQRLAEAAQPPALASTAPSEPSDPAAPSDLPRYSGPLRDAQRAALIREALIARQAVQAGATMPQPRGPGNQANKPLGDYVARTMREQFLPLASECYEALLDLRPQASGSVMLEFSVLGDPAVGGVVVDVTLGKETTLTDETFRTCLTESMHAVVFDAPPGKDGTVSVKQSFELSP